ncbi:MAG: HipA N-terminal domain-containing protein [Bacteroidota bacterium]
MRRVEIYYQDTAAGILTETDEGEYTFEYNANYIKTHPQQFITLFQCL